MGELTQVISAKFSKEQEEQIRFWADKAGQKPAEWIRTVCIKAMKSSVSENEIILGEICGISNLLVEFMREMLIFTHKGDEEAATDKAKEIFDHVMKKREQEARELIGQEKSLDTSLESHWLGSVV